MFYQDDSIKLIGVFVLVTCLQDKTYWNCKEKLHINHLPHYLYQPLSFEFEELHAVTVSVVQTQVPYK